jgi:hypothetical protein
MGVDYGSHDGKQNDGRLSMNGSFSSATGIVSGNWNTGVGASQNNAVTISVGSVTLPGG